MHESPILVPSDCPDAHEFFERHRPAAERWLRELEEGDDPFVASAAHAVFCLLSSFVFGARSYDWLDFDARDFLFRDLADGGTVGMDGPVHLFFEHLVEAVRRFVDDGVIDRPLGAQLLGELLEAREDFLRFYDPEASPAEVAAIERRRSNRPPS